MKMFVLIFFLLTADSAFAVNIEFYTTVAKEAFASGDYATAKEKCKKVIEAEPDNADCKSITAKITSRQNHAAQEQKKAKKEEMLHRIENEISSGDTSDLDSDLAYVSNFYSDDPRLPELRKLAEIAKKQSKEKNIVTTICGNRKNIAKFKEEITRQNQIEIRSGVSSDSISGLKRAVASIEINNEDLLGEYQKTNGKEFDVGLCGKKDKATGDE